MSDLHEKLIEFLQDEPEEWFDAEAVANGIDSDFSEGHVREQLGNMVESREDVTENYWTEEVFGYFFGDQFVPGNTSALRSALRARTSHDVDSMSRTELQSLAEEIANPAPIDVRHRDFQYDG